jgi:hypothetical protein
LSYPLNWKQLGPSPIVTSGDNIWYVTGRVGAAAPDPTNVDILYAVGSVGGVWKTSDSTASPPTWYPLTDNMPSLSIGGNHPLMVHKSNHDLILALVKGIGAGLLWSNDAGQTWELRGNSIFEGASIGSIAADPTNTDLFYVSVYKGGSFGSGIYESTDAGFNWNRLPKLGPLTPEGLPDGPVSDVIITKYNANTLYGAVVGNDGSSTSNNGIYRSANGGATWILMSGLPSGSELAGGAWVRLESGSNPGVIYVVILSPDASNNIVVKRFKTTDDGDNWTPLKESSQYYEPRSWHVLLGIDPNDDDHIFVNDSYGPDPSYRLYESYDAGDTTNGWSRADAYQSVFLGRDWVNIAFDANGDAVVTADQGIYRYSKSKNWTSLVGNLEVTQFYTITPDPQSSIKVYGVGQDLYWAIKFTGTPQWEFMEDSAGEHGKILVDPANSDWLYAYNPLDGNNFVRRSMDGGKTWTTVQPSETWAQLDYIFAKATQKSFIMDPSNSSRLLLGTKKVYELTNAWSIDPNMPPTWVLISEILSPIPGKPNEGRYITALAIAPSNGDTIYAATSDKHLWVTFDHGDKWENYDNGLFGVANGKVLELSIDPQNSNQGFAVTQGSGSKNIWLFQITPFGRPPNINFPPVWINISGDFPADLAINSILVDWEPPVLSFPKGGANVIPALFVGSDRGVYFSTNLGSWNKFGNGLPNTSINSLAFLSSTKNIIAGTAGRGAWQTFSPDWLGKNIDLVWIWKWIRLFEKIPWLRNPPDPPPIEFLNWVSQLPPGLTEKEKALYSLGPNVDIELGQKPGQPLSNSDEFEHMMRIWKESKSIDKDQKQKERDQAQGG